jgi:predicted RNase H-like nuclease
MPEGATRGGPELGYAIVAGVTPCPKGWLVASAKLSGSTFAVEAPRVFASIIDILDERPSFSVVAINAPIGYLDEPRLGGRTCDRLARALLGRHRGAGVHSAPTRTLLQSDIDKSVAPVDAVSRQLLPRFREVEIQMAPYLQRTVYEAQPELSFFQLNGDRPLQWSKRLEPGRAERRKLLEAKMPGVERVLEAKLPTVRVSHLTDAAGVLWTARRIAAKAATRLPTDPEWDSQGLRMEIMR